MVDNNKKIWYNEKRLSGELKYVRKETHMQNLQEEKAMENEINMNEKAKVLVFLDTEDLMRIRGTVDYDAVFARIAKNGDLELLRDDAQTVNGYAVCGEERNAKLKSIIVAGENVQINVFSKKKGKFVPIDVKAKDGLLDLRKLISKPNKK